MNDPVQDARNAGECLSLRVFLQIEEAALAYFIDDLMKRASECRLEKEFSFSKSKRLRQAIDEAIQRYQRMTAPIPSSGAATSIRRKTSELIARLIKQLRQHVPSMDTADLAENIDIASNWEFRLLQCAEAVDEMVEKLLPIESELIAILNEKSVISQQIQVSLIQMAAIV